MLLPRKVLSISFWEQCSRAPPLFPPLAFIAIETFKANTAIGSALFYWLVFSDSHSLANSTFYLKGKFPLWNNGVIALFMYFVFIERLKLCPIALIAFIHKLSRGPTGSRSRRLHMRRYKVFLPKDQIFW